MQISLLCGKDLFPYLKVPLDMRGLGWGYGVKGTIAEIAQTFIKLLTLAFFFTGFSFVVPGPSRPRALRDMETSLYPIMYSLIALT